uniref:Uncharacterized protein n=1 Tax=Dermatophagoides pteronyssinus TaxID=6956 RepID=A0A6P6XNB1_DERPT|nr:putative uncharacterized protein DDB_G0286901 [Dermatophagoides pteronyssinus]
MTKILFIITMTIIMTSSLCSCTENFSTTTSPTTIPSIIGIDNSRQQFETRSSLNRINIDGQSPFIQDKTTTKLIESINYKPNNDNNYFPINKLQQSISDEQNQILIEQHQPQQLIDQDLSLSLIDSNHENNNNNNNNEQNRRRRAIDSEVVDPTTMMMLLMKQNQSHILPQLQMLNLSPIMNDISLLQHTKGQENIYSDSSILNNDNNNNNKDKRYKPDFDDDVIDNKNELLSKIPRTGVYYNQPTIESVKRNSEEKLLQNFLNQLFLERKQQQQNQLWRRRSFNSIWPSSRRWSMRNNYVDNKSLSSKLNMAKRFEYNPFRNKVENDDNVINDIDKSMMMMLMMANNPSSSPRKRMINPYSTNKWTTIDNDNNNMNINRNDGRNRLNNFNRNNNNYYLNNQLKQRLQNSDSYYGSSYRPSSIKIDRNRNRYYQSTINDARSRNRALQQQQQQQQRYRYRQRQRQRQQQQKFAKLQLEQPDSMLNTTTTPTTMNAINDSNVFNRQSNIESIQRLNNQTNNNKNNKNKNRNRPKGWRKNLKNKNRGQSNKQRPSQLFDELPIITTTTELNPIQEEQDNKKIMINNNGNNNNNNERIVNQQRPNDRKPVYGVAKSRSQRHLSNDQNLLGGGGGGSSGVDGGGGESSTAGKLYDVPQIECPSSENGMDRFACPTRDELGRFLCIDDQHICDGYFDCPHGEDEERLSCMFYKSTKAHLDVLADYLLQWARGQQNL